MAKRKYEPSADLIKQGWLFIPIVAGELWVKITPKYKGEMIEALENWPHRHIYKPGVRFAGYFQKVWKRLPADVRTTLLTYWQQMPGRLQIELSRFRLDEDKLTACCADEGYTLRFQPWLDLHEEAATHCIAHELAHAYHWAIGTGIKYWLGDYEGGEKAVHRTCAKWGFPQTSPTKPPASVRKLEAEIKAHKARKGRTKKIV